MHLPTVPFLWLILWKSNPVAHDIIKSTPAQIPAVKGGSASSSCYGQDEYYKCSCLIFRFICSKPASKLRREHRAPWICVCAQTNWMILILTSYFASTKATALRVVQSSSFSLFLYNAPHLSSEDILLLVHSGSYASPILWGILVSSSSVVNTLMSPKLKTADCHHVDQDG